MKKYKLLVALMLLIALIGKSVISLGVTQADVDAEKKKADQLKTEAEQKKKELTNIKSDKAVATLLIVRLIVYNLKLMLLVKI